MESHIKSKTWKVLVLSLLAITVTLTLGFYFNQESANYDLVELDDKVIDMVIGANTVDKLLANEGASLEKGGFRDVSLETKQTDNVSVVINNPKAYTISVDDNYFEVQSVHATVKDVLSDIGVTIEGKDYTYPTLDAKVSQGANIEVYSVKDIVETKQEPIPYEKIVRKNRNLDLGTEKIVQKGQEGLKEIQLAKEYVNGRLADEYVVNEEILNEPVSSIVEKGTKSLMVTSRGNTPFKQAITMSATAYDLSFESCGKYPDHPAYGITASGTKARPGVVAVDPRVIPLGTKLYVESLDGTPDYGFASAEDTGGAIKGNKIDLFFHSSTDVKNFGRRNVKVYILE